MKHLLCIAILTSLTLATYAQNTKSLSAETPVRRSQAVANEYPKITLNDNKCRFDHLAVKPAKNGQYQIKVAFARPCDGEDDIRLTFADLEDAMLVKDLMLDQKDYEFFHLFKEKSEMTTFEIVYPPSR